MNLETTNIEIPDQWTKCEAIKVFNGSFDLMIALSKAVGSISHDSSRGKLTMERKNRPLGNNFSELLQMLQEENPEAEIVFY